MGGNPCKALAVDSKVIGSQDLQQIWDKYDKDGNGMLDWHEITQFLKDLSEAIHTQISPENVRALFLEHAQPSPDPRRSDTGITRDHFTLFFFGAAAGAHKRLEMTASLEAELEPSGVPSPSPAVLLVIPAEDPELLSLDEATVYKPRCVL